MTSKIKKPKHKPSTKRNVSSVSSGLDRRAFMTGVAATATASACKKISKPKSDTSFLGRDQETNSTQQGQLSESSPLKNEDAFDVVIIGSGYGGSVTAARLAESGLFKRPATKEPTKETSIAILERGLERLPDHLINGATKENERKWLQFPESPSELFRNIWRPDNPWGMIRFYPGSNNPNMHSRGMTALTGNGLGGTSLINANIAIEPDSELFSFTESIFSGKRGIAANQRVWPEAYSHKNLQTYYKRAKDTLGVIKLKEILNDPETVKYQKRLWGITQGNFQINKYQILFDLVKKIKEGEVFMQASHSHTGTHGYLNFLDLDMCVNGAIPKNKMLSLNESFTNKHGFQQKICTHCGDCMNGCRHGAKNTMQTNYLKIAKTHGAKIYTKIEARTIIRERLKETGEKKEWGYRIYFTHYNKNKNAEHEITGSILAKNVVVSCGTLGSNELMLRSDFNTRGPTILKEIFEYNKSNGISSNLQQNMYFSDQLGKRFSGNGDMLYIGFDAKKLNDLESLYRQENRDARANQVGVPYDWLNTPAEERGKTSQDYEPVGPCITAAASLHYNLAEEGKRELAKYHRYLLEDASIYGGLNRLLGRILPILLEKRAKKRQLKDFEEDLVKGFYYSFGQTIGLQERDFEGAGVDVLNKIFSMIRGFSDYISPSKTILKAEEAMSKTYFFLGMGHDSSDGKIRLDKESGRAYIDFVEARKTGPYLDMAKKMKALMQPLDFGSEGEERLGTAKEIISGKSNKELAESVPINRLEALNSDLITVHPLGGVSMGADVNHGVVNADGKVYRKIKGNDADEKSDFYDGLYVADGSILPMALGVNPFLTIAAIAERNADIMIEERRNTL